MSSRDDNASGAGEDAAPAAAPGVAPGRATADPIGAVRAAVPTTWAPLSRPVFRMLWLATLAANISMWMNDVAAAWMMTTLAPDPVWVALVQSASTLPVFLLGIPSGALADIVDRRLLFMATQVWVAATAVLLSVLAFSGGLNGPLLLVLVFCNGIGLAMRWPVFSAIVPELVPRGELTSAMALNAISMNVSRIAGPIGAGAILSTLGSAWVFALNAALSVIAAFMISRWRTTPRASALPGERFVGAIRVGIQHVSQSQHMRVVLVRIFVFFLNSTALLALMPLLARRFEGGGAGTYTLMLACMGSGAVLTGLVLPRLRDALNRDQLVHYGTLSHALATFIVALAPNAWVAAPAMALGGAGWIATANSLTLSAQLALPDWVRARGMAIYQTALMAGAAGGAALWGQIASFSSLRSALLGAAGSALLMQIALRRWGVEALGDQDLTPQHELTQPTLGREIGDDEGPVMISIEYLIDPADADEFVEVMRESRRSRLQQGALSWSLFRDAADDSHWQEVIVDESWVEHLRRFDRMTAGDLRLRNRRLALHRGAEPPRITRVLGQSLRD